MKRTLLLSLVMLIIASSQSLLAQKDLNDVRQYLDKQIKSGTRLLLTKEQQNVLNANIAEARMTLNVKTAYGESDFLHLYFIINKGTVHSFSNTSEMIVSKEFIEAINPNFKLKTEEDAANFRAILSTFDREMRQSRNKVFKKDNKWCFTNKNWFGELSFYEVSCSAQGKVTNIKFAKEKIKITELPVEIKPYYKNDDLKLSASDEKLIDKAVKKVLKVYSFHVEPLTVDGLSLNLKLFSANLAALKLYNNGIAEAENKSFIVIDNKKTYNTVANEQELFYNKVFIKALSEKISIQNETDAKKFEAILDANLKPAEKEYKKFYKKENIWCFVRDKFFEDLSGILVLVNKKGKIIHIEEFTKINDEAILSMKTHDPDFKLDYKFTLVEPASNKIKVKSGEEVNVKITFDNDAVNAKNGYIATFYKGEMVGFSTSSTMESPFTDDIPVKKLDKNTKNVVKYALMPSGRKDIKDAFKVIEVEIEVIEN